MQSNSLQSLTELESIIGYTFHDKQLLLLALTHPSYSGEQKKSRTESNQRLEFLGDAVLELTVSDFLYHKHQNIEEGELTRMRASLVCEPALCVCANMIHLGDYLLLGKGENSSGGRTKPSILSDAFEAVIGAIYLDGGFDMAKAYIERFVLENVEEYAMLKDGKSTIQEIIQRDSQAKLSYETYNASEEGMFKSVLYVNNEAIAEGIGKTKKAAEQNAALEAVKIYQKRN